MASDTDLRARFDDRYTPEPNSGCWLWMGCICPNGYGQIGHEGKMKGAHRVSYELHIGPIPEGAYILHRCDVPNCVNPAHLRAGTPRDNTRDMLSKGRAKFSYPGEAHHSSKLTELAVREIRTSSATPKELADRFGVTPRTIRKVRQGTRWAHI